MLNESSGLAEHDRLSAGMNRETMEPSQGLCDLISDISMDTTFISETFGGSC